MKKLFISLFLILSSFGFSQVKLLSWNVENFGKSKSKKEIAYIATVLNKYDLVALQEVVAGYGGAQAVARLADELNRKGNHWEYTISDATLSTPNKTERYAFLWKTAQLKKIGKAWLEKKYAIEIEREPYLCTFVYHNKQFTAVSFHAITKSKQPEKEIKYFKFFPSAYPKSNLIFMGDFNCPQSHSVFEPLRKMGYASALVNQKTSLKRAFKNGQYLASEFDNMYFSKSKIKKLNSGVVRFYQNFQSLKQTRTISDHCPIWMEFSLN
jgi:endonuclease/exonuclease/phosphatase family metal-dependent hydrolase